MIDAIYTTDLADLERCELLTGFDRLAREVKLAECGEAELAQMTGLQSNIMAELAKREVTCPSEALWLVNRLRIEQGDHFTSTVNDTLDRLQEYLEASKIDRSGELCRALSTIDYSLENLDTRITLLMRLSELEMGGLQGAVYLTARDINCELADIKDASGTIRSVWRGEVVSATASVLESA
jgi:hypothetical protein